MDNLKKTKTIGGIVFYSIWLVISLVLWIGGLGEFREALNGDDAFATWFVWGALCIIPIIIPVFKMIFASTKDGARDGANTYSASVTGNTVQVQNHPIRGAIYGLIGGIIGGLLVGPVVLALYIIANTGKLLSMILSLIKSGKAA